MARVSLGSVLKPFQSGPRERPGQSPLRGTPSCQVAQPGEREDQGARACVRAGEAQGVGRGGAWSRVIFPVTSAELAGDAWPGLPGSVWKFKCSQGRQESQGRVGFGAAWRLPWPGGQPAALRRTQPSLPLRDRPLVLPGPTGSQGGQQRPGGLAHSHPHAPCAMSPTSQQPGEDIQELSTLCPGTPSVQSVSWLPVMTPVCPPKEILRAWLSRGGRTSSRNHLGSFEATLAVKTWAKMQAARQLVSHPPGHRSLQAARPHGPRTSSCQTVPSAGLSWLRPPAPTPPGPVTT